MEAANGEDQFITRARLDDLVVMGRFTHPNGLPPDLLRLVLAQGLKLAGVGVALGLAIAYALTRVLANLLFGVKASDPMTFVAVAAILALVALLATYLPARRAAATEPVLALRQQ